LEEEPIYKVMEIPTLVIDNAAMNTADKGSSSVVRAAQSGLVVQKVIVKFSKKLYLKSLQDLFVMIGFTQLIVFLPLLDINFPGNMQVVNGHMIELATYDILPTDDIYPTVLNLPVEGLKPVNKNYDELKYETKNFLFNVGSLFLIFMFMLAQTIFYGFLRCFPCFVQNDCLRKVM
jgi:hypothetical protein